MMGSRSKISGKSTDVLGDKVRSVEARNIGCESKHNTESRSASETAVVYFDEFIRRVQHMR
jgi:hypothetical protein